MNGLNFQPEYILALIGGVIWAVRLEGRVTTQEKLTKAVVEAIEKKLDEVATDVKEILKANGKHK